MGASVGCNDSFGELPVPASERREVPRLKPDAQRLQQPLQRLRACLRSRHTQGAHAGLSHESCVDAGSSEAVGIDEHKLGCREAPAKLHQAAFHGERQLQQSLVLLVRLGLSIRARSAQSEAVEGRRNSLGRTERPTIQRSCHRCFIAIREEPLKPIPHGTPLSPNYLIQLTGADHVWPAAIGLIPILSARASTSSLFHHNEYDCLKAILYNCVRHGPASQNRDGRPDFRGHLLGRVAHVTLLNPSRGGRLRAQFEQIRWDQE